MDSRIYTGGKSPIVKRSVVINGHKTSVSLERAFWEGLKESANVQDLAIGYLVSKIENDRDHANLSCAIRLYVLDHFKKELAKALAKEGLAA